VTLIDCADLRDRAGGVHGELFGALFATHQSISWPPGAE
jgi:hypothetical protein